MDEYQPAQGIPTCRRLSGINLNPESGIVFTSGLILVFTTALSSQNKKPVNSEMFPVIGSGCFSRRSLGAERAAIAFVLGNISGTLLNRHSHSPH